MDASQTHCGRISAKLRDCRREAFRVQPCHVPRGSVFIDPLSSIGNNEGNESTGASDNTERKLDKVKESPGIKLVLRLEPMHVEKRPKGRKHSPRNGDGAGEGEDEDGSDRPQA